MHPYLRQHQRVGQTAPASLVQQSSSSAVPAAGSLTQAGYTADQGAEIGVAVSAVPLVGLLLGAVALSALSPSDVLPQWAWAVVGGAVGLVIGNQLGLAAVNQIQPANAVQAAPGTTPAAFNELAFYQNLAATASAQLSSYIAQQQAGASSSAPTTIPASTS